MIKDQFSKLTLNSLTPEDHYSLSTVPNVNFKGLDNMGLNDLVVELASILDSEAINRIEKDVFVQNQAGEWGISREYVSTRI